LIGSSSREHTIHEQLRRRRSHQHDSARQRWHLRRDHRRGRAASYVSRVTDDGPKISKHGPPKHSEVIVLTLNKLDAIDADRLHRKLGRAWRASEEDVVRRRYRLMCRVYLHLHRALMQNHQAAAWPNALAT